MSPRLHVVVPYHSRDLSRKTLLSIIKSAGLTEGRSWSFCEQRERMVGRGRISGPSF